TQANLKFVNREEIIFCGGFIVPLVFARLDNEIKTEIKITEGQKTPKNTTLIEVSGNARKILTCERVALNLLQRMSSVATLTAKYVDAVKDTKAIILDTRKTMPCLREIDKYAVRIAGAKNHRMRLDDAILIKDNHIAITGSVKSAYKLAENGNKENLMIIVECDNIAQMEEALVAGAKRIMLDNMNLAELKKAVKINNGRAKLEASGNVNLTNINEIAETGIDFISIGRLTHSANSVDIGLDIKFN
ncbi:MAG: carboxylating nicotinate-nucleotide diphosphorylase, partial [Pseudomonadota bacterium]